MNRTTRSVLGMSAGAVLLGVSACATPAGGGDADQPETSEAQQSKALEQFDPCTFFQPDELTSWGVSTNAEDGTEVPWEPGCMWSGDEQTVGLNKSTEETVDSYEQNGSWGSYEKQQIAGRSAAVAQTPSSAANGFGCNVLVDAGGGVAIYQITDKGTEPMDPCSELKKVAEATASRLPE